MEEVVMALRTRPDVFDKADTRINAHEFLATSQLVSRLTSIPVQPNKAVVGVNAFAHEAGIHQDGMLKNPLTYEIMTPQSVGWMDTKLILGKHSGRHGLDAQLRKLGYKLDAEHLRVAYRRFVALADQEKQVTDGDLIYIVESGMETPSAI
jgi:2-isopropylmalate synthase